MAKSTAPTARFGKNSTALTHGGNPEGSVEREAHNAAELLAQALQAGNISHDATASNNVEYALERAATAVHRLISKHRQGL